MSTPADDTVPGRDPRLMRNLKRLDRYVISAPVIVIIGTQLLWPVFGMAPSFGHRPWWRLVLPAVASLLLVVADLIMVRWALAAVRAGAYGIDRGRLLRWIAVVVPLIALTAVTPVQRPDGAIWPLALVISLAASWAAVSLCFTLRTAAIGTAVLIITDVVYSAVAYAIVGGLDFGPGLMAGFFVGSGQGFWLVAIVGSVWSSAWMLRVIMEIDRSRQLAAELAIAEERLRFSRDLHDVFGRTLASVALKSELAEELLRRGRSEQAGREMAAVRQLAADSGREIRGLVRGYREADLDRELTGAENLLDSAGIRCIVSERPTGLTKGQTSTLAWILREAVTNVIRHSHARWVRISFSGSDPVIMTIGNDGSDQLRAGGDRSDAGHGLSNMEQRLSAVGGRFAYLREGDRFTVTATVPASAPGSTSASESTAPTAASVHGGGE